MGVYFRRGNIRPNIGWVGRQGRLKAGIAAHSPIQGRVVKRVCEVGCLGQARRSHPRVVAKLHPDRYLVELGS